jgi:chemotaxis protein MotB
MRGGLRRRRAEEEGESAFVSYTDMTVSFLFIVMIILAFFATQFGAQEERVPRSLLKQALDERDAARGERDALAAERARLLERLKALEAERDALARRLAEVEPLLAQAERDLAEALDRLAALEREAAALRARLAALERRDPLEAYIAAAGERRRALLERLAAELRADFPDLAVDVSAQGDALNFRGDGIFARNETAIQRRSLPVIHRVAERLDALLPCYTLDGGGRLPDGCANEALALVEAVQIEGHTDATGAREVNIRLSAGRGAETYLEMTGRAPGLLARRNPGGQPVLSIAGYGPDRPVAPNDTDEGRAQNRRIDLRFIMLTPRSLTELDGLRTRLQGAIDEGRRP